MRACLAHDDTLNVYSKKQEAKKARTASGRNKVNKGRRIASRPSPPKASNSLTPEDLTDLLSAANEKHAAEIKILSDELERRDQISETKFEALKSDFTRRKVKMTSKYKSRSEDKDRFGQSFRISDDSDSDEVSTRNRVRQLNETLKSTTTTGIDITRIMDNSDSDGVIDDVSNSVLPEIQTKQ
mmetsp:Transcript_41665/g.81757  ORF Transcript_41665/g.81757 Transcript_41665/m.81757 type:complete len:184 (-) Transcript_41665:813-1364(-)